MRELDFGLSSKRNPLNLKGRRWLEPRGNIEHKIASLDHAQSAPQFQESKAGLCLCPAESLDLSALQVRAAAVDDRVETVQAYTLL